MSNICCKLKIVFNHLIYDRFGIFFAAFHTSDDDDSPANAGPSSGTIGPKNKKAEDADHSNVDQITDQLGTMNIEDRESSSEQDHSVG